ncbi:hypothetical protein NQZ68_036265 [Dissostichus eleginoides]|nr:hypothetical protein NQZ68_036265 [Dissostichus eleginoides]
MIITLTPFQTSFLLLITLSNEGTKTLQDGMKPIALLCIGCALITPSVLLFLKSLWKACYKTSKPPRLSTVALVLFFEFLVAGGAAILTIVAMPHLDIVINVTILNGVAVFSALLQIITQCTAKERNCFLVPSITAFILILLAYILFLYLYITKDPTDKKMAIWVGLAVVGSFLVSLNWWESYFRLISENISSVFLKLLFRDMKKCQNLLNILSSLLRIAVTASVLGAYIPLNKMDWSIVTSIPSHETKIIAIIIGVQLISSALCHWFSLVACKMHALRRCFILPLYLASLAVIVLFIVPVIIYYQDYKTGLNGTAINFTGYCSGVVDGRNQNLTGSVFQHLVYDVTHTLCFLDMSNILDIGLLTGSAVSWWLGLVLATVHLWYFKVLRIQRTQDLFTRRLYEGTFIEQSLLLNTRYDIQTKNRMKMALDTVMVYLCATMWHENYDEMMNIIISIFRLDKYRPKNNPKHIDFTFEAHIYFDDAFENVEGSRGRHLNTYAQTLVEILAEVYAIFTSIDQGFFKKSQNIPDQKIITTPYGGLMGTLSRFTIRTKNSSATKRDGLRLMSKYYARLQKGEDEVSLRAQVEKEKRNTYLLALDGDTDFQPAAVMLLIDRLKMYPRVGAACGRIHPTGSGPAVWFQKFEYAISHWLQKTAEHVIGCVLCSPGCFSLFRAEALMDDNVMKKYSTKSTEASNYIQYDQGEDRWLCTLLLKQGWRVEYNAASDAYTNAPEDFKELYNQRRRWGPSTMANVVDLLGSTTVISKKNSSISKLFMFYQLIAFASSILAPATICLMIAGSFTFMLNLHGSDALVLAVIPPLIYLILCFYIKSDTQITIAGIMSVIYAFLMLVVTMTIIGAMVRDKTILTPSSLFVIAIAIIYIVTAILHPQEIQLVFHGLPYILCIPSAYLLLTIYSMVNMNNVSWGTRETKPAAGAAKPEPAAKQTDVQKAKNTFQQYFSWCKCCKKSNQTSGGGVNLIPESPQPELQPQNSIVEDVRIPEEEQSVSRDMKLEEDSLEKEEESFWIELQKKYLEPLLDDKERQKKIVNDLRELRNKINFAFFISNALWLVATFTLQLYETTLSIQLPKINLDLEYTGENLKIEPIGFMFILGFGTAVIIQFLTMFYHRQRPQLETQEPYLPGKKVSSVSETVSTSNYNHDSDSDSDSDVFDVDLYTRDQNGATPV